MKPDDICKEYSDTQCNLAIEKYKDYIVIKGNKESLEFIGKLLIAQATYEKDDSFQIAPKGAGSYFFSKKSKYGVYILRE
jgi:hypothetical protein